MELPPGAETVPQDHLDNRNDDVYAANGWVVIDGVSIALGPESSSLSNSTIGATCVRGPMA
ncbi:hypothetical protein [Rhodococcoides fascians]|uniref:hypothetical protein n=1 Tax=Rhodococcoides fascians TaxID=1828 RepID=UPI000B1895C3|nr:hypothetical protein [Rhodococcus fascians]